MNKLISKICSAAIAVLWCCGQTNAQLCPPNLNFSMGDFSNWACGRGKPVGVGNTLTHQWADEVQDPTRHRLIRRDTAKTDYYGGFSTANPAGERYSVRLGNDFTGADAEYLRYTFTVPSTGAFSILYYYAVVFEDPGHASWIQPRFIARVRDRLSNTILDCVSFTYTAAANLPGFSYSSARPDVLYKEWTPVSIDLSEYAGREIDLEFINNDCSEGGHFGYAYVALSPMCSASIDGTVICDNNDGTLRLTAPYGYEKYIWYTDETYTQVMSSSQTMFFNPAPPVGSVFPVRIIPYAGFGCEDTLFARITGSADPLANAGPDVELCPNTSVTIGSPPVSGYMYSWTPASMVSDASSSQPYIITSRPGTTQFILTVKDALTGCTAKDTTLVTKVLGDNSVQINGRLDYCEGEVLATHFSTATGLDAVQWYRDGVSITGATQFQYQPVQSGDYTAVLYKGNCTDTTQPVRFRIHPLPVVSFPEGRDTLCARFRDAIGAQVSYTGEGILQYRWTFWDGNTSAEPNPFLTIDEPGVYPARLRVYSPLQGCADSADVSLVVLPRARAGFTVAGSICVNNPVVFNNNTSLNGASSIQYQWDFGNGETGTGFSPVPAVYATAGEVQVSLAALSPGCEHAPDSYTTTLPVSAVRAGINMQPQIITGNQPAYLQPRSFGLTYRWEPPDFLNNPALMRPLFEGTESRQYLVKITDASGCFTTDTLSVIVLKKEEVYMPSAFSPNGDGLNDWVRPFIPGMLQFHRFVVYNRQGNQVFLSTTEEQPWDGRHKGQLLSPDVFVWMVEYTNRQGQRKTAKGTLTLVK